MSSEGVNMPVLFLSSSLAPFYEGAPGERTQGNHSGPGQLTITTTESSARASSTSHLACSHVRLLHAPHADSKCVYFVHVCNASMQACTHSDMLGMISFVLQI